MKFRILKAALLFAVLIYCSGCFKKVYTDRKVHGHRQYRSAGRYW